MFRSLLGIGLIFLQPLAMANQPDSGNLSSNGSRLGVRVDCLHDFTKNKGSTQDCAQLSGTQLELSHKMGKNLSARVRINPFGVPSTTLEHQANHSSYPLPTLDDTYLRIIDFYELRWQFRPNLALRIEEFGGTTLIPSTSGLALASRFQDSGWDQTAMTATYSLSPLQGINVKIAIGNGEGENGKNLDPQQYGGLRVKVGVIKGVNILAGISFDGNNIGSESYNWIYGNEGELPKSGYSTERIAAAIELDGTLAAAYGLKLALGWQRVQLSDLDKKVSSIPTDFQFPTGKDVNYLWLEDADRANQVSRNVINFNLSYKIMAEYFVGLDYETQKVDVGVKYFEVCGSIDNGECSSPKSPISELERTAYTVGVGKWIGENLVLTLEYNTTSYKNLYKRFHFNGEGGKKSKSLEAFNARFAYNWE